VPLIGATHFDDALWNSQGLIMTSRGPKLDGNQIPEKIKNVEIIINGATFFI
jgi:hypothetical protein